MDTDLEALARFIAAQERNRVDSRVAKVGETDVLMLNSRPADLVHEIELSKVVHPHSVPVQTLRGVVDAFAADLFGSAGVYVNVISPSMVEVVVKQPLIDGNRTRAVLAEYQPPRGLFDEWLNVDDIVVWLLSGFVPNDDSARLLALLGKGVKLEATRQISDDGISSQLKSSKGVTGAEWSKDVHPHFTLKPHRSFPEVDQAEQLCTFRTAGSRNDGEILVRLIESDGGAWKHVAIGNIGIWLKEQLEAEGVDVPILM